MRHNLSVDQTYSVFLLSLPWAPQLSWNIPAEADVLCDNLFVLASEIKETCCRIQCRHKVGNHRPWSGQNKSLLYIVLGHVTNYHQRISDYLVNCVLQHTVPVNYLTWKNDKCSLQKYIYGRQTAIMKSIHILPTMRGEEQLSVRHS